MIEIVRNHTTLGIKHSTSCEKNEIIYISAQNPQKQAI